MKFVRMENEKAKHWREKVVTRLGRIIKYFLLVGLCMAMGNFLSTTALVFGLEEDDRYRIANENLDEYLGQKYDYRNVLVLGVNAKQKWALDLQNKYRHFDIVIPVSRERGSSGEDWAKAAFAKLGIRTASLKELEGKTVENLYAHSWGSSETINAISMGHIKKVQNLHLLGSPEGASLGGLDESIRRGVINKVNFHINEGDAIANFRHFPDGLQGGFNPRVDFHFYKTEQNNIGTELIQPNNIPIFNAPLGFDKYIHYNSPKTGHGVENYLVNLGLTPSRGPEISSFNKSTSFPSADLTDMDRDRVARIGESIKNPPIPSYWTYREPLQPQGKTMTEVQIMTEMVRNKHRAIIVGTGPAADLMHKNMVARLGKENVGRMDSYQGPATTQFLARKFGADVILGVKDYESLNLPRPDIGDGKIDIDGPDFDNGPGDWPESNRPLIPVRPLDSIRPLDPIGQGVIPNDIGGVMLHGAAEVSDAGDNGSQLTGGMFSLIFQNGNGEIDIEKLRKFTTALWAVYFSEEGPGISIDPIAPGVDKHLVRYIGKVVNSDLGRVMRETDYIMKKWAVGTERPDIAGFENPDDIAARRGIFYVGAPSRFWFVPEDMRFKRSGNALIFEDGRMAVKTEYLFKDEGMQADPANEEFARFFTDRYDEIAEKYPVYKELFEYAKLVSLARYLKERGLPMLWFLLTNKDMVITEDSPGTVDAFAKNSDYLEYVTIEGGVDLACKPSTTNYVIDEEAASAIRKAIELYGPGMMRESSVLPSENITFETRDDEDFTLTPSQTLTLSSGTATGDKYQTDVTLRYGKKPGLELVRYYDPEHEGPATFGKGWHLMIPYQVKPYGERMIEFLNAMIPEKMMVKNLITGREEVLTFSQDRYSIAGYAPDELQASNLVGLFLLSDASFRLADKLGNEFQFDQGGYLTEMVLSENHHFKFEYGYAEAKGEEFAALPYQIEPFGDEYEDFLNVRIPKKMRVINLRDGGEEVLVFGENNRFDIAGYTPVNEEQSKYTILAFMSDGSFVLGDKYGNEISFDPAGSFEAIRADIRVVKGFSQGNYRMRFNYEFEDGGPRIREAHITKKDQDTTLYAVKYEYGQDGRLCRVTSPTKQKAEIGYDGERVMVARKEIEGSGK